METNELEQVRLALIQACEQASEKRVEVNLYLHYECGSLEMSCRFSARPVAPREPAGADRNYEDEG